MKRHLLIIWFAMHLAGCANDLFYYPDRVEYLTPEEAGQKYENVYFTSSDGTNLHGWFVPAVGVPKATIVHFHGNAQNISAHYPLVYWLPQEGYNLFTFDYRGYGKSKGKPDREGVYADSLAAIDYIVSRPGVDTSNLIILGQSLGGANAIVAASERKQGIKAVIVESTFSSYQDIAREKARGIPISGSVLGSSPSILTTNDYSPINYIDKISPVPLLIMHGTADRVIPISHSKRLIEKAREPKQFWILNDGAHLEAFSKFLPELKPKLLVFIEQSLAIRAVEEMRSPLELTNEADRRVSRDLDH